LSRNLKHGTAISLILLTTALLVAVFGQSLNIVSAQDEATVVVLPTSGGTTTPGAGTYTYANGTVITLSATPATGYVFQYWIVAGETTPGHEPQNPIYITDPTTGEIIGGITRPPLVTGIDSLVFSTNPVNITCGYGYTYSYQAVFLPTSVASPTPAPTGAAGQNATVIIMPTTGGTVSPTPGQYTYANGTVITFSATPAAGYKFSYWIATGDFAQSHTPATYSYIADENGTILAQIPRVDVTGIDSLVFTQNPAHVTCGYGYTFTYTAYFTPVSTTTPTPTVAPATATPTPTPVVTQAPTPSPTPAPSGDMTTTIIIAVVVIVVIIIIVIAAVLMRRKK
jgi:hypothetical protein